MTINLDLEKKDFTSNGDIRISTRDLNLFYGDFQALRNINLDIPKNAITAIMMGIGLTGRGMMVIGSKW